MSSGEHSTPYTLHPTPYTLHPTPYTLHPAPYLQVAAVAEDKAESVIAKAIELGAEDVDEVHPNLLFFFITIEPRVE